MARFVVGEAVPIDEGAEIFNGRSGIWHLHYAHLAHDHMPQNTDCDPSFGMDTHAKKDTHASSCERMTITQTHVSSNTSPQDSDTQYPFVAEAYGTCTMPIWLTTTCPKTLIVTGWILVQKRISCKLM